MKNDYWKYKQMSNYELKEITERIGYDKSQKRKAKMELNRRMNYEFKTKLEHKAKQYPEYFKNPMRFEEVKVFDDSDSFAKDLEDARKYAKKTGGELYTIVDADRGVMFEKGWHYVNRLGYAVVR